MSFKPVNPKEEVERIYQKVMYESSDLYKENNIVDKVFLALKGRSPKELSKLWFNAVPFEFGLIEKGYYYLYEVKGSILEFYIDNVKNRAYFGVTKYVGTKQYTRSCIIKEDESFDRLWTFLSDQEKEYQEREKWLEDILDELNGE
jgi:hypothetical protein